MRYEQGRRAAAVRMLSALSETIEKESAAQPAA